MLFMNLYIGSKWHSAVFVIVNHSSIIIILRFNVGCRPCFGRKPKFGPSISSVCNMAALLIGQFGSILYSMYLIKSLTVGWPIMPCMDWALQASDYSLNVSIFNAIYCVDQKRIAPS